MLTPGEKEIVSAPQRFFGDRPILTWPRQDTLRSAGAAWAPRAGHRLLARALASACGEFRLSRGVDKFDTFQAAPAETGVRLWLMGGVGVDPFDNATPLGFSV